MKTPRIIEAFRKIKRADFLPEDMKDLAELNEALPIGYGQTISQPLVVAFMIELLEPKEGEKILDIGSGSGWTTTLLAEIIGENGKVIAIEVVPELKEFGEKNVSKYNFLAPHRTCLPRRELVLLRGSGAGIEKGTVEFICADGSKGHKQEAPYDKILASASVYPVRNKISNGARNLPPAWKEQLKIGGRIVTPIGNSIWLFIKKGENEGDEPSVHLHSALKGFVFEEIEYPGFVFVPLIEK